MLLVALKTKKLTKEKALETLNKLAKGDFRISTNIYLWAFEKIERY